MRPRDARSDEELALIIRGAVFGKAALVTHAEYLEIGLVRPGPMTTVTIPRDEFNRLVEWYLTDQAVSK